MDRGLHRLRDERGTSLIEVIVAAVLLVVIAGSITSMVNAAQSGSSQQRLQAIAADLAQSSLEDLRGQKFAFLQNLDTTTTPTVDGFTFEVRTQSTWAMESPPGARSCAEASRNPEALRLTATVTWKDMKRKPVVVSTLAAAPPGASGAQKGAFVAQITNSDGRGVAAIPVTLGTLTSTTDASGCVRFVGVPAGRHTLSFSRAGYITPEGQPAVSQDVDVVAGQTRSGSWEYDQAGTAAMTFVASRNVPNGYPAPVNTGVQAAIVKTPLMNMPWAATPAGSTSSTADVTGVYPTSTNPVGAWEVYPDSCTTGRASSVGVSVPRGGVTTPRAQVKVPLVTFSVSQAPAGQMWAEVVTSCGTKYVTDTATVSANSSWRRTLLVPSGVAQYVCIGWHGNFGSGLTYGWRRWDDFDVTEASANVSAGNYYGVEMDPDPARVCT